jgi:hypothetical protein
MDVTRKEFMDRVDKIALNINMAVFILENPISGNLEAYTEIEIYKTANPNLNNYNELSAKNITNMILIEWHSLTPNQKFDTTIFGQRLEKLNNENVQFSSNWDKWMWIHKK